MKEKSPQISTALLLRQAVFIFHFLQHCALHMQALMLLRKIANLHSGTQLDSPLRSLQLSNQKPQKGSLAGTVRPYHSHPVPLANQHIHMVKEILVTIWEIVGHILKLSHPLGTFSRWIKGKIIKGCRISWLHNPLQSIQLALPSSGLLGLNPGLILADIFLGFFYMLLLFFIGRKLSRPPLLPHLHIIGIVSLIGCNSLVFNLKNPVSHPVQEKPVMGNNQHPAGVILQKSLQPLNHAYIQMVGRLVQKQKIRLS